MCDGKGKSGKWRYIKANKEDDENLILANATEAIGGKVIATYQATSPSGKSFTFTNEDITFELIGYKFDPNFQLVKLK